MSARICLLLLLLSAPALAQGFAGLGGDAEGFSQPQRGVDLGFPRDHGAHPDFRVEWWYVTANLSDAEGREYGAQWTLFRTALAPGDNSGWSSPQLWMGHAAVTSSTAHLSAERLARGGVAQAGVTLSPFTAWIDDWTMAGGIQRPGGDAIDTIELKAAATDFSYALTLIAKAPLVLHGDSGYSVKSAKGQASYYYSQPSYAVSGTVRFGDRATQVTGQAWFDHEWSSQPLSEDQTGWDWFSLHFGSGEKLMGFRLRDAGAGFTSATWINADGTAEAVPPEQLRVTPEDFEDVAGRSVPVRWRIALPSRRLDVTTSAVNPQSWMSTQVSYWEGPVRIEGTHDGRGYVEMTGYR